jgi:tungstate transport system substrate-binding protein
VTRLGLACFASLLLAGACRDEQRPVYLDIATTTSVKNSGLIGELLPAFEKETEIIVRAHATGSDRALEMLADDVVDLALTHAPQLESKYLDSHPDWVYRNIAFNRFVIVGPPHDPAAIRSAPSAAKAFARIAAAHVNFVSRNDQSGTHERESALWVEAGARPDGDDLLISGGSMAIALRHTSERVAYTLSDEATFRQLGPELDLDALYTDDDALLNTYAVTYRRKSGVASVFMEWLTAGSGRRRLESYRVAGVAIFHAWPLQCPSQHPTVQLCAP